MADADGAQTSGVVAPSQQVAHLADTQYCNLHCSPSKKSQSSQDAMRRVYTHLAVEQLTVASVPCPGGDRIAQSQDDRRGLHQQMFTSVVATQRHVVDLADVHQAFAA